MSLPLAVALIQVTFSGYAPSRPDTIQAAPDEVVTAPAPGLEAGWSWAESTSRERRLDGFWIGWLVDGDTTGESWYYTDRRLPADTGRVRGTSMMFGGFGGSIGFSGAKPGSVTGSRDPHAIAILLRYERRDGRATLVRMHIGNTVFPLRFGRGPLLWLGRATDRESVGRLATIFASDSPFRTTVVTAVGVHRDAGATAPRLRDWIEHGDSAAVRRQAAVWLGRQHDPGTVAVLERVARGDGDMGVRRAAIQALGGIRDASAVRALTGLVQDPGAGTSARTRRDAVVALGMPVRDGPPAQSTIDLLLRVARNDPDGSVRLQAVTGLVTSGAATPAMLTDIANDNPDVRVQQRAVQMLAQIDSEEARDRLADIAEKHPDAAVRRTALQMIAAIVTK